MHCHQIALTQRAERLTKRHNGTQYRVLMTKIPSLDQTAAAADAMG